MKLGKLGIWIGLDSVTAARSLEIAKRVEARGYSALWIPESRGRNVLVNSAWLLAGTQKLIVAPGIANIYARDAMAMAAGQRVHTLGRPRRQLRHSPQLGTNTNTTWSPALRSRTPAPTSTTMPAPSCPGMVGKVRGRLLSIVDRSEWQMPAPLTCTSTSPSPGPSRSTVSMRSGRLSA